jgi:U3 small nucleolar RNA-associated protein 20
VFHKFDPKFEKIESEETQTYFQLRLDSWRDRNLTLDFKDFVSEIQPYIGSLPLILLNKETIVNVLIKHLKVPESLALEPLLE